jgi:hypothetical protein
MPLGDMHIKTMTPRSLYNELTPFNRASDAFRSLLAAVDLGWNVEDPVKVFPSCSTGAWIFIVVVSSPEQARTSILYLPAERNVIQFIEQNNYQVIEVSDFYDWRRNENIN